MTWNWPSGLLCFFICFITWTGLFVPSSNASTLLSDSVFGSDAGPGGRNLLQAKKACPVNFEFMNYTVITSQCKGPSYPVKECCSSFKDFACPYAEVLNDLENDCASTMFSYINLYGKYPPGLFSSQCKDGKQGLDCPASSPSQSANDSGSRPLRSPQALLILSAGFIVVLLQRF
ncbi:GPI-anchored protein LLG1 [Linum grandiflorum]